MKSQAPQHQVLFLDDDRDFLEAIGDFFVALSGGDWQIHSATSADEAAELLKSGTIKLLVVDVNMPVLDGIQFAELMHRRHPSLKMAVLTSDASDEKRAAALAAGADLFLEKNHTPEGMKAMFTMLGELLNWSPRDGFQGVLRSVGLQDVIQMECVGRNCSVIEICNEQILGRIYIEEGHILHAAAGELTGERALGKLLSLPGGSFELAPFEPPPQRTLNASWELLLAEAHRGKLGSAASSLSAPGVDATKVVRADPSTLTVAETIIGTGTGEPLYEDGCVDARKRMDWLLAVAQQAAQFNHNCPLGPFDRLDIQYSDGRAVAQPREDRLVYVRVTSSAKKGGAAA